MSWANILGRSPKTGRVYTQSEIRELEEAAWERGRAVERAAREEAEERTVDAPAPDDGLEKARAAGYTEGLHYAWRLVDALDGRPGKNQIRDMLKDELDKAGGAAE